MRQMISGLVAAVAVVAASAAPAMACGGLFTSGGCSPCAAYSPCAQGYYPGYYGGGYGVAAYERLPSPTQYYYVNQGPTFSGPGNFAPVPTYHEAAVSGWNAYSRPYYHPYDGGRYARGMYPHYRMHDYGHHYGHHHGQVYGSRHHHHGHHHSAAHHHH